MARTSTDQDQNDFSSSQKDTNVVLLAIMSKMIIYFVFIDICTK